MNAARPADLLRRLEEPTPPDRDLLARFVRERDQSAFRELVVRHGAAVLGVCLRVTRQREDAEDAFQAVFLVLARKAARIRQPDVLGCWLHGVALRVAQTARRAAIRRRAREVTVCTVPDVPAPAAAAVHDLAPVLDEELAALPSWYREAIILCELQGLSREDAAKALRVPEGTLSSRLAKGRKTLSGRLARRGITLSAAVIPVTLCSFQAAGVSSELIAKSCRVAEDWTAGVTIPKPLAKLAQGELVMRKLILVGVLTSVVAVAGIVYAAQSQKNPRAEEQPKAPVVVAKPAGVPHAVVEPEKDDKAPFFTSNPKLQLARDDKMTDIETVRWSPDGNRLAFVGQQHSERKDVVKWSRFEIHIVSLVPKQTYRLLPEEKSHFVGFTPDSKYALTELREYGLVSGFHKLTVWEPAPNGDSIYKVLREIQLPSTESRGYAFSHDGKTFRTVSIERSEPSGPESKLEVQEYDFTTGKLVKSLLKVEFTNSKVEFTKSPPAHVFSSDGRKLAAMESLENLVIYDVDRAVRTCSVSLKGGLVRASANFTGEDRRVGLEFSPDGHRLVVSRNVGPTLVVNTDTGDTLPALEGGGALLTVTGVNAFNRDGRLLALCGIRYSVDTDDRTLGPAEGKKDERSYHDRGQFLNVWDTQTGKLLKSWNMRNRGKAAFNPERPVLALLEPNDDSSRLGLWDFSAEEKK